MASLSAPQASRVAALLARLSLLEESAAQLVVKPAAASAAAVKAQLLHSRAKQLEARMARLELLSSSENSTAATADELFTAARRVMQLENGVVQLHRQGTSSSSPNVSRVFAAMDALAYPDYDLVRVPNAKQYYEDLSLVDRARMLQATNTDALCKTLLFSASGDELDRTTLFLLVVNYTSRISASKFKAEIRRVFPQMVAGNSRSAPKQATEEVMHQVLGFPANGVSVVGGLNSLPIVFAASVEGEVFLGGGEVDVKLRLGDASAFAKACGAHVLDVTEPRTTAETAAASATTTPSPPPPPAAAAAAAAEKAAPTKAEKRPRGGSGGSDDDTGSSSFTFDDLDVRVGLVTKCWRHPESAKLLCEEIDLGEPTGPRQIASGIQAYYAPEQLQGKRVCVVANLKPAKLGGFASNGMVLCASTSKGGVVVVEAPAEAALGSRLVFETNKGDGAAAPAAVKKKKILEKVLPQLKLDQVEGVHVEYAGKRLRVDGLDESKSCQVPPGSGEPGAPVS